MNTHHRAAAAASLLVGVLTLSGCAGHTGGHPVAAPSWSGSHPGVSGAGSPSVTGAPAFDVMSLWQKTLQVCPRLREAPTLPPADPLGFGVQEVWPTDSQVNELVEGLRPGGTEEFTEDKLVDLRVVLANVRHQLASAVATGTRAVQDSGEQGFDPQVVTNGVRRTISSTAAGWEAQRDYVIRELDDGNALPPTGEVTTYPVNIEHARATGCAA